MGLKQVTKRYRNKKYFVKISFGCEIGSQKEPCIYKKLINLKHVLSQEIII